MAEVKRPFGITLLQVLVVVAGVFNILWGVLAIIDRNNVQLILESGLTSSQILWTGVFAIGIGALQVFLGMALGRGNEFVRVFFGVIAAINLGLGIWGAIALSGEQQASSVLTAVVAGLVLWLLFNGKSDDYFEKVNS